MEDRDGAALPAGGPRWLGGTATSQSRLSHALAAPEHTAPGHVARVSATVLDPLGPREGERLSGLLAENVTSLEAGADGEPPPVAL